MLHVPPTSFSLISWPNHICQRIQITKLLIVTLMTYSNYFLPVSLRSSTLFSIFLHKLYSSLRVTQSLRTKTVVTICKETYFFKILTVLKPDGK